MSISVRSPALLRVMGRRDLTAAVINSVIGAGIFGLPSALAAFTGAWSPAAVLLAGLGMLPIAFCVAEVGSRFDVAGGPYLYTREAFGATLGFHVGWLLVWTRLLSMGAVLNVLAAYLATLAPWVGTPFGRAITMTTAVALFTAINLRGVRQAAWTVNLFTVAKLLPLLLVILLGLAYLKGDVLATQRAAEARWNDAVLAMVFAFGGFEVALIAAGEVRRPRQDTAFAIIAGMLIVTAVYALTQLAVMGVLPHAAGSPAPIADALRATLGAGGAVLGSVAAAVSTYGWLTGSALLLPRLPLSMAERGELPQLFGRVHHAFRTPHVAILSCSFVALAMAVAGSFVGAATLSAIGRLVMYGIMCGALLVLRRRGRPPAGFVLPAGNVLAIVGIVFSAWLLSTRSFGQAWIIGAVLGSGVLVQLIMHRRGRESPP
jgi:basic amino acid/polyamine antiporter, APA family